LPIELQFSKKYQTKTLKNKISVTHFENNSSLISISVLVKTGSANEKKSNSGSAHFLEHMHFKGTTKRTR